MGPYVTDTSPSASSLSSGSSWVDPDNGTLSETHSTPPFYLEGLVGTCYRMDELQGICENVVERLFKTRNRLDEADFSAIPNRLRAAFAQIGHRFHAFLDQHAHRTTIERLVSARTLMNVLLEINRELDSMQRNMDFDEEEWESTWSIQVRDVEENLVSAWEANVKSLRTVLPDAEAQLDALTLLKNEVRQSVSKRGTSSQGILEAAAEAVVCMSDTSIGAVPDRFIPEHEVQKESTPFCSGSRHSIPRHLDGCERCHLVRGREIAGRYVYIPARRQNLEHGAPPQRCHVLWGLPPPTSVLLRL